MKFDLLQEPWIPTIWKNGEQKQSSLTDVLSDADKIIDIYGDYPTVTSALYRLLIGISASALRGAQYNKQSILSYLEKYGDSFDLFDDKKPFLQSNNINTNNVSCWSIVGITNTMAYNNNVRLFDHNINDERAFSMPLAARWMVAACLYTMRSNPSYRWSPATGYLTGSAVFYLKGDNLQQTLELNQPDMVTGFLPWECKPRINKKLDNPGTLDILFHNARVFKLILDGDNVRYTYVVPGVMIVSKDYMSLYKEDYPYSFAHTKESGTVLPMSLWYILPWVAEHRLNLNEAKSLQAICLRKKQSKPHMVVSETIPIWDLKQQVEFIKKVTTLFDKITSFLLFVNKQWKTGLIVSYKTIFWYEFKMRYRSEARDPYKFFVDLAFAVNKQLLKLHEYNYDLSALLIKERFENLVQHYIKQEEKEANAQKSDKVVKKKSTKKKVAKKTKKKTPRRSKSAIKKTKIELTEMQEAHVKLCISVFTHGNKKARKQLDRSTDWSGKILVELIERFNLKHGNINISSWLDNIDLFLRCKNKGDVVHAFRDCFSEKKSPISYYSIFKELMLWDKNPVLAHSAWESIKEKKGEVVCS